MKTQTIQVIDGLVGISVFLLLAVAIIAGQAQVPQAAADDGVTPHSEAARSSSVGEGRFSLLVETPHEMPAGGEVVIRRWREDVPPERHPGVPE